MRAIISYSVLILHLIFTVSARKACHSRDYGNEATVCVCNTTYCDDLDPIVKTAKGVIKVYETSKSGDRFKESQLKFGSTPNENSTKSHTITLDKSKKYQKIIGFGGAFTDSAGINLAFLTKDLQNKAISDYFSINGIEYTMGRIPIGGTDFSTHPYTNADKPDDFNLDHFDLTKEDLLYKIPYLQMAQKVSPHKVNYFGSPWSSPAWMKTNNKINNGGFLIGKPGDKYYKTFANLFVKFMDYYKKHNVSMWGLTIDNEPASGNNPKYGFNSLGFTPELQRDFIKLDLGPTLIKAGYGGGAVKVMIHDDQRPVMRHWADVILTDKEAAQYVAGSAFHWYDNKPQNLEELDKTYESHKSHPNYFILNTESSDTSLIVTKEGIHHVVLGNWHAMENYVYDIITDLNHWTAGYVDWNIVLDLEGGPSWVNNSINAPIVVNKTGNEYYKQPVFYGLGHFSKFLVPDSVRIHSTAKENLENFETTAFVRPDGATVVVAFNKNAESVALTIDDPNDGKIMNIVKPHSIQSYIWYN